MKSDRERQISYDISYMWNIKNNTNELIYKTETDSQTYKTNLWSQRGKAGGINKEYGINRYTIYKIVKQQGFTV